ncbi:sugar phosphate nucleotidyltransferase [soil metagenome]
MKVVIPVAGYGTRLRPHTLTTPKVLLNVAGKPMLHFIVEQLLEDNIGSKIIFITGFLGDQIESSLTESFAGKGAEKFEFIVQDEPKGLGHAIHCAKPSFSENEELLIILGDTLFDVDLKELVSNKNSVISVQKVDDPTRFGVVETNENGEITKFVEKPSSREVSPSDDAIIGLYLFKNSDSIFSGLEHIVRNELTTKGEYQLTDAMQHMLSNPDGKYDDIFSIYHIQGWLDCGKPETLLETNRYLLKKHAHKYNLKGVKIKYPIFIGKNAVIENSTIGPFATINDNCEVRDSVVENSIINQGSVIEDSELNNSIIGEYSLIKNSKADLNIGPYSEIHGSDK